MLNVPLIAARALHLASSVMVAGAFLFVLFVEPPALRQDRDRIWPALAAFRRRLARFASWSLAIGIASGAAWLLLLAASISGSSVVRVISDGTVQTVLTRTQFGHDWEARLVLAALLAAALVRLSRKAGWRPAEGFIAAVLAMGFVGSLAWSGHGGATPGVRGEIHVTADALHLVATGAWIGGLLPLRLLLSSAEQIPGPAGFRIALDATLRFSTLGIVAVATLIITGVVNTWILVGSLPALIEFQYGRLLLLKIAIFLVLLAIAAFNRVRLMPRLAMVTTVGLNGYMDALRQLRRNCLVETGLGAAILIVVSVLGTIAPDMNMQG